MTHRDSMGRAIQAPIHGWFGLSYSSYFVIPRLALQELPVEWQERFIALIDEAFEVHGMMTPNYHVLREGAEYTFVTKYDPDDETSRDYEFIAHHDDPWANYRRGRVADLLPDRKVKPSGNRCPHTIDLFAEVSV